MILLRFLPPFARFVMHTFYRFSSAGGTVPATGPVLIVANHPNMVADPGAVQVVAGRPVRFLAKVPLFRVPILGSMLRSAGAVPVYRKSETSDPIAMNEAMFRAVERALIDGSAVGVFPEGTSHSEPALGLMKTGAARIALESAKVLSERGGPRVVILPVGLTYRSKERFRSQAFAFVGREIEWLDLSTQGAGDADAVRELTRRIDESLRTLTINLDQWEDEPVIACAEAILTTRLDLPREPRSRVRRFQEIARALRELRVADAERVQPLLDDLQRFAVALRSLGIRPEAIADTVPRPVVLAWILRHLVGVLFGAPILILGTVLFWIPYRLTGLAHKLPGVDRETTATVKMFGGGSLFVLWIIALAIALGMTVHPLAGVASILVLPLIALGTAWIEERRRGAFLQARSYLMLRGRRSLRTQLVTERDRLATQLDELRQLWEARPTLP